MLLTTSKETRIGTPKKKNNNNNNIKPHSSFLKFLDKDYNKSYFSVIQGIGGLQVHLFIYLYYRYNITKL
jgi:hypothetical protein